MVTALTCDARPQYNNYAKKFQNTFVDHGHALKQLFRLSHGAGAEKVLNSYITTLANRASAAFNFKTFSLLQTHIKNIYSAQAHEAT